MKFLRSGFAVGVAALIIGLFAHSAFHGPARADEGIGACKETNVTDRGATYRVLFANNGSVQQYYLVTSSRNQELDHDVLSALEKRFGPEASNAPPLRIVSFRPGNGGMMIPDKAIDSCGRVSHFH